MQGNSLRFQTAGGAGEAGWLQEGDALRRRLAAALEAKGFAIDYEAGRHDPDWLFAARRGEAAFAVVLINASPDPCRWIVDLEDGRYHTLQSRTIRDEVHPVLQAAVESWPGVSEVRWHQDPAAPREPAQ